RAVDVSHDHAERRWVYVLTDERPNRDEGVRGTAHLVGPRPLVILSAGGAPPESKDLAGNESNCDLPRSARERRFYHTPARSFDGARVRAPRSFPRNITAGDTARLSCAPEVLPHLVPRPRVFR